MTTLHLGENDIPYSYGKSPKTTAEVGKILEAKYELYTHFYEKHKDDVLEAVSRSLAGALENILAGAPIPEDPYLRAGSKIETLFRQFISNREIEGMGVKGVPTAAALHGVNHRLKHPYRKSNARRPSFRDTGTLVANFKAWVD